MARKLEVEIVGDSRSLERALGRSGSAADGFGKKVGGGLASVAKLGAVAVAGLGVGVAAAGKRMIEMASDAGEVQSKMQVVFGNQLPGLTKEIDKFSQATGTSKFAMREQAADMGALLAPMLGSKKGAADMSLQFTKLATDLGSFNNVPTADALLAIRSGLVGEAEPLRAFGVLLNEAAVQNEALRLGLVKKGETLTEQEKVQARASLIMQQTALAQGDATRTADSMANQMKRLKSEVGDAATEIGIKLIPYALKAVSTFNDNWPQIQRVVGQVFNAIGVAVNFVRGHFDTFRQAGERAWDRIQQASQAVAAWYRTNLGPAIQNVISAAQAIWERFGGAIIRIATINFGMAKAVITAALNVIKGTIDGVLALIRGDWGKAWESLKLVVSSVFAGIGAIIRGFASIALTAASAIGRAIIDGILAGVGGLYGMLKGKLESTLKGVLSSLNPFSPVEHGGEIYIGRPLAEGALKGWVFGSASLPQKMADTVRAAVERARVQVEALRGRFGDAWSGLGSEALAAFDGVMGQLQTKSETALAKMQAARDAAARAAAVTDARSGLAGAVGNVAGLARKDDEDEAAFAERRAAAAAAVVAAQKQLDDALFAQREFALQQRAAQERLELDAKISLRRRHFEQRLQALQASLAREGATEQESHERIVALFKAFGVTYRSSGKALGQAFATGLRESVKAVEGAADAIADAAKKRLKLNSPAEEGPLSDLDTWWRNLGATLAGSVDEAPIRGALDRATGPAGGGRGGEIVIPVTLTLDGQPVLTRVVRANLQELARRTSVSGVLPEYGGRLGIN